MTSDQCFICLSKSNLQVRPIAIWKQKEWKVEEGPMDGIYRTEQHTVKFEAKLVNIATCAECINRMDLAWESIETREMPSERVKELAKIEMLGCFGFVVSLALIIVGISVSALFLSLLGVVVAIGSILPFHYAKRERKTWELEHPKLKEKPDKPHISDLEDEIQDRWRAWSNRIEDETDYTTAMKIISPKTKSGPIVFNRYLSMPKSGDLSRKRHWLPDPTGKTPYYFLRYGHLLDKEERKYVEDLINE